jgi:hypothetical protein
MSLRADERSGPQGATAARRLLLAVSGSGSALIKAPVQIGCANADHESTRALERPELFRAGRSEPLARRRSADCNGPRSRTSSDCHCGIDIDGGAGYAESCTSTRVSRADHAWRGRQWYTVDGGEIPVLPRSSRVPPGANFLPAIGAQPVDIVSHAGERVNAKALMIA